MKVDAGRDRQRGRVDHVPRHRRALRRRRRSRSSSILRGMSRRFREQPGAGGDATVPYGPREPGRRGAASERRWRREHGGRGRPVLRRHRVRALRRRRLRRGLLGSHRRRRGAGRAAARGDRPLDRAGVGGEPRLADLLLVVLWTGFAEAFASIMLTLFVPLTLAALGIVLRGSSFAFRKEVFRTLEPPQLRRRVRGRRRCSCRSAWARSPARSRPAGCRRAARPATRGRAGSTPRRSSAACSRSSCAPTSPRCTWCWTRAVWATTRWSSTSGGARSRPAFAAGFVAFVGIVVLHDDARYVFDGLTSRALPLVIVSAALRHRVARAACARTHRGARAARDRRGRDRRDRVGRRAVAVHPADDAEGVAGRRARPRRS